MIQSSILRTNFVAVGTSEFFVDSADMDIQNILGNNLAQLTEIMTAIGEQPYRGRQLFKWLYNHRLRDFDQMTDLSLSLRQQLKTRYEIDYLTLADKQESQDGTVKMLFKLSDGSPLESVLIPEADRNTVCISSQVGCALACKFCATGTMGLIRDLTVGEIIGQLLVIRDQFGNDSFTNVVFMGMGEPFNNYRAVLDSLSIMTDSLGLGIGAKRITVSTSGVTPKIRKFADSGSKARLALSLHAATQEKRAQIMPIAQTFHLDKLMEAIKYYTDATGFRVTIEYVLLDGFNDTREDILALSKLIRGIPCKINLLAYNAVPGIPYQRPSDEKVDWFARELYPRAPAVTVRKSRGDDIAAACGQLAGRETK